MYSGMVGPRMRVKAGYFSDPSLYVPSVWPNLQAFGFIPRLGSILIRSVMALARGAWLVLVAIANSIKETR